MRTVIKHWNRFLRGTSITGAARTSTYIRHFAAWYNIKDGSALSKKQDQTDPLRSFPIQIILQFCGIWEAGAHQLIQRCNVFCSLLSSLPENIWQAFWFWSLLGTSHLQEHLDLILSEIGSHEWFMWNQAVLLQAGLQECSNTIQRQY